MTAQHPETEPIVVSWPGGTSSVGYLGGTRWRVRISERVLDFDDTRAAAAAVLEQIFRGTTPGRECAERDPIRLKTPRRTAALFADPRMLNGWTVEIAGASRFDLGAHSELLIWAARFFEAEAHVAWANGVERIRPAPLGPEFSFQAFLTATDRDALSRRLGEALMERIHDSIPFMETIDELRALGHDLWSWDDDVWGCDYMTRRPGAGLEIHPSEPDDEDDVASEDPDRDERIHVRFRPRDEDRRDAR